MNSVMDIRLATQKKKAPRTNSILESFRVISEDSESWPCYKTPPKQHLSKDIFGFGFINEPKIVDWKNHRKKEFEWVFGRPSTDIFGITKVPLKREPIECSENIKEYPVISRGNTEKSLYKDSFQSPVIVSKPISRHLSNPFTKSYGIIPVLHNINLDKKKVWRENLSFENIYDCRSQTNYPIRGKRLGTFVWNEADSHISELVNEKVKAASLVLTSKSDQNEKISMEMKSELKLPRFAVKRQNKKPESVVGEIIFGKNEKI